MKRLHQKLMGQKGFFGGLYRMIYTFTQLDIPAFAANASYFIMLATLPTLLLLLALLRYTPLDSGVLLSALSGVVPEALMPIVGKLINSLYERSSTALVSVSAVAAVWSASRGIYGLVTGLNRIYGVKENRGYLYTRTMSVFYMILFIVLLLLTLAVHVFGQAIAQRIPAMGHPLLSLLGRILPMRVFVLFVLQTLLFTAIYMAFPNRRNSLLSSLPGAVFTALGWLGFTDLFSVYVENFSNYSAIYGSLSTVALAMLWLYVCISIIFYGGALNRYLMDTGRTLHRKRRKKKEEKLEG